jgi:hypothetical protein
MIKGKALRSLLAAGLCGAGLYAQADIVIDGFTPATNDRFANDGSFILDGVDLSGVGMSGIGRWGTLVSPNVFLSAFHFPPALSSNMQFFQTNDPNGPSEIRSVASGQRIGTSDVWVGVLDSPLPAGYTPMAFATDDITSNAEFMSSAYAIATASLFGRSQTTNTMYGGVTRDQAVGENILDAWFDSVIIGGTTNDTVAAIYNLSGDGNYLPFETWLQSGDSGGPMVVVNGTTPTVVGVNWFIFEDFDINFGGGAPVLRNRTGFSYVGNYDVEIQQIIDAHIPEPGTLVLAGIGFVLLLRRRMRPARG